MRFHLPSIILSFILGATFGTLLSSCQNHSETMSHTNELINETSPYLRQHARNPVNWYPWKKEALDLAKSENKLMIISIGYSSCHWCHVMAHESFEDDTVAELMNSRFINIKVDREERPDIDQVYMTAVQLMTRQGGWPLNVVTLPDGRPIWGGTYFRKEQWVESLRSIDSVWRNDPEKVMEYAEKLEEGVRMSSLVDESESTPFHIDSLHKWIQDASGRWDDLHGGPDRAPKFPMPVFLDLLFHYDHIHSSNEIREHLKLTLLSMARGGIYDQVGGGFARYSVDVFWKVPHFEKMLYDNAQLLSTYSYGLKVFHDPEMERIIYQTREFLEREMRSPDGGYYSALDADSDGEEGKFYTWTIQELITALGDEYPLFSRYYDVEGMGHWEGDTHILLRHDSPKGFAEKRGIEPVEMNRRIEKWNDMLLAAREKRNRPGLDDKILTAWNGLLVCGYLDAYSATGDTLFLRDGISLMNHIQKEFIQPDGRVLHGKGMPEGFMDDHSIVIRALIQAFGVTGMDEYLETANKVMDHTLRSFGKSGNKMLFFRPTKEGTLFAESQEVQDNVIPAGNSIMARNLFHLSRLTGDPSYEDRARDMLSIVLPQVDNYPEGYANWLQLGLEMSHPFFEVAIVGPNAGSLYKDLGQHYLPQAILLASEKKDSDLDVFAGRWSDETRIFVCQNRACKLPVSEVGKALKQLED